MQLFKVGECFAGREGKMNSPLNLSLWIENPSVALDACLEKGGVAPIENLDDHRSHLDGTGYGDGIAREHGTGDGNGYGNGDGYGDGYGYGNGNGNGNGDGDGNGYGNGDGDGYGG